jgi:UDP-N-acetylmuramoyl-L-alanyl-D-glutamate--2,6-diaminopimelate ligase
MAGVELVGVTGTNGKTSVVSYAQQILTSVGHPAASYGSLGVVTPSGHDPEPDLPPDGQTIPTLMEQVSAQVQTLVFEATSFALARGVLDRLRVRTAVFTNLSQDHLDVHGGSMSVYLGAKSRLFIDLLPPGATAILGEDEASGALADFLDDRPVRVWRVGSGGNLALSRREPVSRMKSVLHLRLEDRPFEVEVPCSADFQAANLLFAIGIALDLGIDSDAVVSVLPKVEHPPGRFEEVGVIDGVRIIVDYAHNPHSLATVLRAVRSLSRERVGVVFGCGGDRDRAKRHPMGAIASELADVVVVTDDNARSEDPAEIRRAIVRACPEAQEVADRREAIRAALPCLGEGDVLVVAGRGDERYQEIAGARVESSDLDLVRELVG